MNSYSQQFRKWIDKNSDKWPDILGWLMLGLGLIVFTSDYLRWSFLYVPLLSDLLLRMWPELIGIGLAVIIIDNANELIRLREEKKRLILQMGSPNNAFAIEAVRQIKARGWLEDGSLHDAFLRGADLGEANLYRADLMGARLMNASLKKAFLREAYLCFAELIGADLAGAYLTGANLMEAYPMEAELGEADLFQANLIGADLRGTNLREADLEGAKLMEADLRDTNLTSAKVTPEQLGQAKSLEGATMPDGTIYSPETFKDWLEEQESHN